MRVNGIIYSVFILQMCSVSGTHGIPGTPGQKGELGSPGECIFVYLYAYVYGCEACVSIVLLIFRQF